MGNGLEEKNVRFLDKFGPDTFHVLIRFDHFRIIISWSRERNVVLGSKLSSLGDAAKCNLVAASENVNNIFEIERKRPTRLFLFANLDSIISKEVAVYGGRYSPSLGSTSAVSLLSSTKCSGQGILVTRIESVRALNAG